ncbi:cytochrome P450 71A1-like [Hibiscus syriacus]|uniref:cytochrome P450 71A1-like n=1 Tax=Hibiscus syriacus TaxID=106335 RepID=UPI0019222424|nr:cytochrome P450 71A1-like [Hibiscus syriacus]
MELLNVSNLSSNPLLLSLIPIFSLLIWLKLAKGKNMSLPPSPPKLPIIGNSHQFGKLPHRSLRDLSKNYGSLMLLNLGYNPTLVVSSVDTVREIVKNHDVFFSNRPRTTVRKRRRNRTSHQQNPFYLCRRWVQQVWGTGEKANGSLHRFLCWRYVPYLRWVDVLTGYIPSMKALSAELDGFLIQVIQEHRAVESREKNFVSIIMKHQKDGMFEDLTQENIKAILLDMFVGGTDTSATATEWIMAELLKHPNAMEKVQQEVRNVVGNKSKVDQDDITKMEYLKCVVKETLRLHPPVVFVPRKTSASIKLEGFDVPSDTTVLINAWAIHRDPKWWENPEEFIPERFENSSIDFQGQDFHYIPFGFGRRDVPRSFEL